MDPMQKVSIHYCNLTKKERATCDLIMENPEVVIHNPLRKRLKFIKFHHLLSYVYLRKLVIKVIVNFVML